MPISEKQFAANPADGAKARGPVNPGGKYNSSRNAIRDGFLATSVLLPGESRERFLELYASLIAEFAPASPNEFNLVETMAVCSWRQLRLWTVETASLSYEQRRQADSTAEENLPTRTMLALRALSGHPHSQENLRRQEVSFDRQYHRAANIRFLREKKRQRTRQVAENKEDLQ